MLVKKGNSKIMALFLVFTIFTKEIGMFEYAGIQWDIIGYPFFLVMFIYIIITHKIQITKKESLIFGFLVLQGILGVLIFNSPFIFFVKQFSPILIMYCVTKYLIIRYGVVMIFKEYLKFALVASLLGLIQFSLKLFGILFLTDYAQLFVDSVALEPSHFVILTFPAIIYLFEKRQFSWQFFIIVLSLVLTFKLTFFLAICLYIVFKYFKSIKLLLLILPLSFLIISYLYNSNIEYFSRIEGFLAYIDTLNLDNVQNLTSFSFLSNLELAFDNFFKTYGLGIGLGGHETSYYKYFSFAYDFTDTEFGLNARSAHSLLIRCISELGLFGILFFYHLINKILSLKSLENRAINYASAAHFLAKFIKVGSYFDYGTIFFLVIIITSSKPNLCNRV